MPYTLTEAAKAVGRDRSTVLRMIKNGKVSATRDEATGIWMIEPAELHRVYAPVHATANATANTMANTSPRTADLETTIRTQAEQIADLRARLDRAETERREAQARVMALLGEKQPAAVPARRGWAFWRR